MTQIERPTWMRTRLDPATSTELLTPSDVAARLKLRRGALYQGLRRALPWISINGRLRLKSADLEAWIDAHREQHAA